MTATTTKPAATQREIVSEEGGTPQKGDSPAVRACTRARIPATDSDRSAKTPGVFPAQTGRTNRAAGRRMWLVKLRAWVAAWWMWTAKPPALRQLWDMSKVDPRRIPGDVPLLRILWHISNWTDRLVLFALIGLAPTWLAGPVRWLAPHPFRRYGLYLCVAGLTIAYLIGRN